MIAWPEIVARFAPGDTLRPLAGTSRLTVDSVDDERICIRQKLWLACVTPADIAVANDILAASPADLTPVQLAERIRAYHLGGSEVTTDCTRVPNLTAVVLYNLKGVFR